MSSPAKNSPDDPVNANVSIEEMLATTLGISGFSVRGAERTNLSFIERVVAPPENEKQKPQTFEQVIEAVSDSVDRLRSTGCFNGVDAYLDRDPLDPSGSHVTYTVVEKSLYQVRTGTTVETTGDREASLDGSVAWRNMFGNGESLQGTAAWWGGAGGDRKAFGEPPSNSLNVEFSKPFYPSRNTSLYARIGQSLRNHEDYSGYSVNVRSAELGFLTLLGRFAYNISWRNVCNVDDKASILVRDDSGHSLKSSLLHRIAVDRRDDNLLPTSGYALTLDTEVAGLGNVGDVSFLKSEASAQANLPFGASGIAVGVTLRSGVVVNSRRDPRVRICDRFHLGGANSLRGFRPRGVGPRDGQDALGGEAYYIFTAMVSAPTPEASLLTQLFNARVHAFATIGDVGHYTSLSNAAKSARRDFVGTGNSSFNRLANTARVAVGLGIAGETALGRVEINLCNPLRCSADDRPKTGVQFGLSQSLL